MQTYYFQLETESQAATEWFKLNEIIVNSDKVQAIVIKTNAKIKDSYPLNINDQTINSENSVKLFGIEIDNKLHLRNTYLPSVIKQATN